jgi:Cft2 family RNA processing exonuclease
MDNPFEILSLARGYQIGNPRVQFDTVRGEGPAVISHAHADHAAEDRRMPLFATPETAELLRLRGHLGEIVKLPYDRWQTFRGWRMKLLPAGHILGSAQVLIEREDGARLLYTGDMKTRPGRTAEPARFEHADDLIIETTFGLPIFRFPSDEEIGDAMIGFALRCFENDEIPVFTGYSLGKSQEIMSILASAGIPLLVHPSTWQVSKVYARFGYDFGDVARFSGRGRRERRAWVMPPSSGAEMLRTYGNARLCYVSGWAMLESRRRWIAASLLAPLSDHADYYELFDAIRAVEPARVWTVHGPYAELFARDVTRTLGIPASSLDAMHETVS